MNARTLIEKLSAATKALGSDDVPITIYLMEQDREVDWFDASDVRISDTSNEIRIEVGE